MSVVWEGARGVRERREMYREVSVFRDISMISNLRSGSAKHRRTMGASCFCATNCIARVARGVASKRYEEPSTKMKRGFR